MCAHTPTQTHTYTHTPISTWQCHSSLETKPGRSFMHYPSHIAIGHSATGTCQLKWIHSAHCATSSNWRGWVRRGECGWGGFKKRGEESGVKKVIMNVCVCVCENDYSNNMCVASSVRHTTDMSKMKQSEYILNTRVCLAVSRTATAGNASLLRGLSMSSYWNDWKGQFSAFLFVKTIHHLWPPPFMDLWLFILQL